MISSVVLRVVDQLRHWLQQITNLLLLRCVARKAPPITFKKKKCVDVIGGSLVYMQHLQIDSVNTITYCAVPTAARYEKKPHIKSQQQYH